MGKGPLGNLVIECQFPLVSYTVTGLAWLPGIAVKPEGVTSIGQTGCLARIQLSRLGTFQIFRAAGISTRSAPALEALSQARGARENPEQATRTVPAVPLNGGIQGQVPRELRFLPYHQ